MKSLNAASMSSRFFCSAEVGEPGSRPGEIGVETCYRVEEDRPAATVVVAVGRLPAVEVGDVVLQVECESPRLGSLLHGVELVSECGSLPQIPTPAVSDQARRRRRRCAVYELGPDRHRAAAVGASRPRDARKEEPAGGCASTRGGRVAARASASSWTAVPSVTMIASATEVTTRSAFGTCMLTMIPASAAGTTPVSLVQARNASSSRDQSPAPVDQQAGKNDDRAGDEDQGREHGEAGQKWSAIDRQGRLAPSVMKTSITIVCDTVETNARISSSWWECMPSPRRCMLPEDQAGEERAEVAAPSRRVDREEAPADTAMTTIAADSRQMPGPAARDDGREHDAEDDSERGRDVRGRRGSRPSARSAMRFRSGRRRRTRGRARRRSVVERRLGDDRLRDLRAEPRPARRAG